MGRKTKLARMIPKDLGVKIISKEEKYWVDILDNIKVQIEQGENVLKFNKACLEMVQQNIDKVKAAYTDDGKPKE